MADKKAETQTFWNDMPEGQQRLYKLCSEITLRHQRLLENQHPLATSDDENKLIRKANDLFSELEKVTDFSADNEAISKLVSRGSKLREHLTHLIIKTGAPEYLESSEIALEDDFNPQLLAETACQDLAEPGYKLIEIHKQYLKHGERGSGYGDYVNITIKKSPEGKLSVEYEEMFEPHLFNKPHIQDLELLTLARIVRPQTQADDFATIKPDARDNYPINQIVGPNVRFSNRYHDYGGNDYAISVDADNLEQTRNIVRFLLESVKNNPREERQPS